MDADDADPPRECWDPILDEEECKLPILKTEDLIGRTFLKPPEEDGSRYRARIVAALEDKDDDLAKDPMLRKFRCQVGDEELEEVFAYNDLINYLEDDHESEGTWKYKKILAHAGPFKPGDKEWKGSRWNVLLLWEGDERTWEPIKILKEDDPVTLAIYAKEHGLLEETGWKSLKRLARRQKKMVRMLNQSKLKAFRTRTRYKYGYIVPNDHDHAMRLDRQNGNTKWKDSEKIEIDSLDEYSVFGDRGKNGDPPEGYRKITAHLVYDIKHDGRHKSRMVAGGHLTPVPVESVYSSVVSLRGVRICAFLAELNDLDLWAADVGNAYLEALTKEKVYIIAGPEFGEREGHTLIILKALYGMRSSGARWHERFADILRSMGFTPSKAEPDIWMRARGDHYEYIAVYVDDVIIASKDPKGICESLSVEHKLKLKGTGPISFHLGCDFYRDDDGTLCMAPKAYIERMVTAYEQMFGEKPRHTVTSPLEKGDHPELDTSEELDVEGIKKYQSLIGAMQWAVSLGRFDVTTAVMTMSSFRAAPRKGHLERVKRIYGYLSKMRHAAIVSGLRSQITLICLTQNTIGHARCMAMLPRLFPTTSLHHLASRWSTPVTWMPTCYTVLSQVTQ